MTDRYQVFVRRDNGKFEKVIPSRRTQVRVMFDMQDCLRLSVTIRRLPTDPGIPESSTHAYSSSNVVMFRDLDLTKPVPDDVQAVVCWGVTDELCEGDYAAIVDKSDNTWEGLYLVSWRRLGWELVPTGSGGICESVDEYTDSGDSGCYRIGVLGHFLKDKIDKNGDVVER